MKRGAPFFFCMAVLWSSVQPGFGASSTSAGVGGHALRVVNVGVYYTLVGIPFMPTEVVRGRLDAVDADIDEFTDNDDVFGQLSDAATNILLVREGAGQGMTFLVTAPDGLRYGQAPGRVVATPMSGDPDDIGELQGNERFSVHPCFHASELFPTARGVLPAGPAEGASGMVLIPHETEARFQRYWLSDGTLTGGVTGWHRIEDDGSYSLCDPVLFPGRSFFVYHPKPVADIDLPVFGDVLDIPLRKTVTHDYTFAVLEYNLSRTGGDGMPSFRLGDLRLSLDGFQAAATAEQSDRLHFWDVSRGCYASGAWLREEDGEVEWRSGETPDTGLDDARVIPGEGFLILNNGASYIWRDGE